jgi:hypothetical protein
MLMTRRFKYMNVCIRSLSKSYRKRASHWSPDTHTIYYFLGFHDGYRAEWYSINYPQQYPVPTQNQQTINNYISIYGNGNTVTTGNEQGNNQGP